MREMDNKLIIWEVLKLMAENPRRKAIANEAGIISMIDGILSWEHDKSPFVLILDKKNKWNTLTEKCWTIIEPPKKLKEMSFGEAMYIWSSSCTSDRDIISCVTNKDLYRGWNQITKEEYEGFWTVKGVYKDD